LGDRRPWLFYINFSSFKPDTENNANFDVVSNK